MKQLRFGFLVMLAALLAVQVVTAQETVSITVRCRADTNGGEGWRCDNFAEVETQVEEELGIDLELTLIQDNKAWEDYKTEFVLASSANEAPDIILSGHEDIGAWAPAGYIIPLDGLIAEHEEFEDIVPTLWDSHIWNGEIWGVPQDAEARPIFYSKLLLSDLGWTEEEIESLPQRVADGDFTFEDMLATAQQAVDEGVVEEGNGFWHRTGNGPDWLIWYYGQGGEVLTDEGLVFDREAAQAALELISSFPESGITRSDMIGLDGSILNEGVASTEDVLFYQGGTWNWANWALNFVADQGGNEFLLENLSLMLFPSMNEEVGPVTLTHPLSYMISSSSENPEVAMALIAAVTTPEANNRHAIDSFHLGILNAQLDTPEYIENEAISQAHYMLDYTTAIPNDPGWTAWSNAWWTAIQAAFSGEATPEEAVEMAVTQLENELGDAITIR
jgi:inositol-phosphate transport system substrate-binding protein